MNFSIKKIKPINLNEIRSYIKKMPIKLTEAPFGITEMFDIYLPESDTCWFVDWMNNISAFPIYFLIDIPGYWRHEYASFTVIEEINYEEYGVEYNYCVIKVKTLTEFSRLFSLAITVATSGKLVMWVTNENVYRTDLFKNGIMDFKIIENQSLFCIGHDGESLLILTNDKNFQNHDTLIKTFPSNTTFSIED